MACSISEGYSIGILIVSDSVSKGEKEDHSGKNLERILKSNKFFPADTVITDCVADDLNEIKRTIIMWADEKCLDLILTIGGTGFSPRDVTPEATKSVIDRDATHLASYMIMSCTTKTKYAVLSRSVCGMRHSSLILNLPGSKKGSQECFEMIAEILPHAMDQLRKDVPKVSSTHVEIQGGPDDRNLRKVQ